MDVRGLGVRSVHAQPASPWRRLPPGGQPAHLATPALAFRFFPNRGVEARGDNVSDTLARFLGRGVETCGDALARLACSLPSPSKIP